MSVEEAQEVMVGVGKFFEVANGPLMMLFKSKIPETLLPYPKPVILEALNLAKNLSEEQGNNDLANALGSQLAFVELMYVDNEDCIKEFIKNWHDPTFHKSIKDTFGRSQKQGYQALVDRL